MCASLTSMPRPQSRPTPLPTQAPVPTRLPTMFPSVPPRNRTRDDITPPGGNAAVVVLIPCANDQQCPAYMVCFGGNASVTANATSDAGLNWELGIRGSCDCARTTFHYDLSTGCTKTHPSLYVDLAVVLIPALLTLVAALVLLSDLCTLGFDRRLEAWGACTHAVALGVVANLLHTVWRLVDVACAASTQETISSMAGAASVVSPVTGKACSMVLAQLWLPVVMLLVGATSLINLSQAFKVFLGPRDDAKPGPRALTFVCFLFSVCVVAVIIVVPRAAFWCVVPTLIITVFGWYVVSRMAWEVTRLDKSENKALAAYADVEPRTAKLVGRRARTYVVVVTLSFGVAVCAFAVLGPAMAWNLEGANDPWNRPAHWLLRLAELIFTWVIGVMLTRDAHSLVSPEKFVLTRRAPLKVEGDT